MRTIMNRIVIVDTGIDLLNDKLLCNQRCVEGFFICRKADNTIQITSRSEDKSCIQDEIGHGTGIAEIICSHNKDAELIIIKIFSEESQAADEELLYYVMEYALNHLSFDILNLSLGLSYVKETKKMEELCELYREKNKFIVAAHDNAGALSFPASFKSVIGVTTGETCYKSNDYYITDNEYVNISAKGRAQRVYWKDGKQIIGHGNSYACAHFTGILSNCQSMSSLDELKSFIVGQSVGVAYRNMYSSFNTRHNPVSQYKKVVVFPFNKEIHSLVRFSENLPFELVDVYDIKYSARVGAQTNALLNTNCKKNYIIKDINKLELDSFDTLILGHTDELLYAANSFDLKTELIHTLLTNNKKIYSFDNIVEQIGILHEKRELIYSPIIEYNDRYIAPFGKLYRQDKPVLGIFGTSSSQGKMTLQLKIRYELIKRGYQLCQLGTEPSSLLYGMEGIFPIGYNSTVSITRYDTVAYINKLLYDISRNSDLIIVGGQSGIVMREEGNLSNYIFSQIDFLYATLPDNIVLCVNAFDDFDVIHRTIKFAESAVRCKVIALTIYPFYYDENDVLKQHLRRMSVESFDEKFKPLFESNFNLPVFFPNDTKEIESLCDIIENSFSDNS